jgi:protein-disulfide isomerase/uncharacterized membrane protein
MTSDSRAQRKALTIPFLLILAGVLLGLLFSGVLIYEHNGAKTDLGAAVCDVGNASSCEKASQSSMGKLFGIPLALFGFIFYGGLAALAIFLVFALSDLVMRLLFWGAISGLLFDLFLLLYSITVLGGLCRLCAVTYVATILIVAGAHLLRKRGELMMKPDIIPMSAKAGFSTVMVLAIAAGIFFHTNALESQQAINKDTAEIDKLRIQLNNEFYKKWKSNELLPIDNPASGNKGSARPVITITEFADPICPHCKSMGELLDAFAKKHPDTVKIIFRHYPLDMQCNDAMKRPFHIGACDLARAMECGQAQDKFWQMHDAIFAQQQNFTQAPATDKTIADAASGAGLNASAMSACMRSQVTMAKVKSDIAMGNRIKISGTPTVLVNGRRIPDAPIDYVPGILEKILSEESRK